MSAINNGGPAFPLDPAFSDGDCDGMSLRDYFAAKAMQQFMLHEEAPKLDRMGVFYRWEFVATQAYRMADAMLKARATGEQAS